MNMNSYVNTNIRHLPAEAMMRSTKMRMIEFSVKYILVEGRFDIMPKHTERHSFHLQEGLASHVEFST